MKTKQDIENEIFDCERKIDSAYYWMQTASNPLTIRNRKNEIKIYKLKIGELKGELQKYEQQKQKS